MKVEGKVALVTGGSTGIGKAICEALLEKGAKGVTLCARNEKLGKETADELCKKYGCERVLFVKTDVSSESQLKECFVKNKEKFGDLDILVNNAGVCNEDDFKKMMDVNLIAVINGTYFALDYMAKKKGGNGGLIVNIASVAGLHGVGVVPAYCASKFGVVGFTRAMSMIDTKPLNLGYDVRVNAICPTWVRTDLVSSDPNAQKMVFRKEWAEQCQKFLNESSPNANYVETKDVADAFMQCVDDDSLNGACIEVLTQGFFPRYPGAETDVLKL